MRTMNPNIAAFTVLKVASDTAAEGVAEVPEADPDPDTWTDDAL